MSETEPNRLPARSLIAVRRYPITVFFSLTLLISWSVWFSVLLVPVDDGSTRFLVTIIGSFGPALSAFLISARLRPANTGIPAARWWLAWVIATGATFPFVISWSFLDGHPNNLTFYGLSLVLSGLAGLVIANVWSKRVGVRDLMASLVRWRVSPKWYLYAAPPSSSSSRRPSWVHRALCIELVGHRV